MVCACHDRIDVDGLRGKNHKKVTGVYGFVGSNLSHSLLGIPSSLVPGTTYCTHRAHLEILVFFSLYRIKIKNSSDWCVRRTCSTCIFEVAAAFVWWRVNRHQAVVMNVVLLFGGHECSPSFWKYVQVVPPVHVCVYMHARMHICMLYANKKFHLKSSSSCFSSSRREIIFNILIYETVMFPLASIPKDGIRIKSLDGGGDCRTIKATVLCVRL